MRPLALALLLGLVWGASARAAEAPPAALAAPVAAAPPGSIVLALEHVSGRGRSWSPARAWRSGGRCPPTGPGSECVVRFLRGRREVRIVSVAVYPTRGGAGQFLVGYASPRPGW